MANQLWQVFRTYTTKWDFWWGLSAWLLVRVAVGVVCALGPSETFLFIMLLMSDTFLGMDVGRKLGFQFANPRARLLPRFAAAHLLVAGAIVAATVATDGLLAWTAGVSTLAMVGRVLVFLAMGAWGPFSVPWAMFVCLLIAVLPFSAVSAPHHSMGLIFGGGPLVSLALACAGLAGLLGLVVRLLTLCEDSRTYAFAGATFTWDLTSRAGKENMRRLEAQMMARYGDRERYGRRNRLDALFRLVFRWLPAAGPFRRLLLRQLAGGAAILILGPIQIAVVLSYASIQYWLLGRIGTGFIQEMTWLWISLGPFLLAMVGVRTKWFLQRPHLARESLYPLIRTDFVGDIARSVGCDMAAVAIGHCVGIAAAVALFALPDLPATFLLPYLALTVAQYTVAYAIVLWPASFGHRCVTLAGLAAVGIASAALLTKVLTAGHRLGSPVWLAGVVLLAAAVAAALYRLAFRRWCRVDLG